MTENQKSRLLVTGASGQLGRRVIELLLEAGEQSIVATTRTPDKLSDLVERGVSVRYADFDDPASLKEAFADVERLLLISTDELGVPGKRLKQHTTAVQIAEQVGVEHVLYTSLLEPIHSPVAFAPDHAGTEQALQDSTLNWTILRNNLYMDMLVGSLAQAYQMGGIYKAAGDGKVSYITREDCARVAAAALADTFNGQRLLDVTGPEALSQGDIASIAVSITGQPLHYVAVELEAVIDGMVGAGLPRPIAEVYASIDTAIAQGTLEKVSTTVKDLTGSEPTTVADFLKAHQAELMHALS